MATYLFPHLTGVYVFVGNFHIKEHMLFPQKDLGQRARLLAEGKLTPEEKKLQEKYKKAIFIASKREEGAVCKPELYHQAAAVLSDFSDKFSALHKLNIALTKMQIRQEVQRDVLLVQAVNAIKEIDMAVNTLSKRLREWFGYALPEFKIEDQERYVELLLEKGKGGIVQYLDIKESMGIDLTNDDLKAIRETAQVIQQLMLLRKTQEQYLEHLLKEIAPNVQVIAGTLLGAKLIAIAGSLKQLAGFPSSTVQLLGAEKALFRHLRDKKHKAPKFGILHEHPLVLKAKEQERGKVARTVADKLSIAAKVDYFKGTFVGHKLAKELEKRFK